VDRESLLAALLRRAVFPARAARRRLEPGALAKRIGEAGVEWLLTQTIAAATSSGAMKRKSLSTIVLDTRVQPKAAEHQAGCYAHARQYRRMHREIRRLRNWLGPVVLDAERKARKGIVVGMRSMPGNPYGGHTVDSALEQVQSLTETPAIALAIPATKG